MADVMVKVISANDIKNGSATIHVDKFGTSQQLDVSSPNVSGINQAPNPSGALSKYTNRFDDITYYTT